MIYGITGSDAGDPKAESVNGHLLSQAEKRQRRALIRNIKEKGYEQVIEEVAYTWFNRFAALRFMEVNGYLPSHIRVFTNDAGEFKPQILAEAIHLELDGLDMNKVYELENANKSEELFKYLLIVQCNALNSILPGMFQRIEDYTELLLPDYLLREGSVVEQMVTTIPEEDWTDQVQIIGWLYQYYNTEPKDKVFADLKKNIKITKENIPAATQLFTPDWIVHYMVENSLGRLWLEGHPNDALKSEWKYYLDEAEQEPEVQAQLTAIRKEYAALKPEEIRVIDPCMGSGHILCVLFDVLVRIYEDYGYTAREAAVKIVENNLWGLDIDERAAQLSYFAVMMKARQYDRRFFTRKVQPHVYAIHETNVFGGSYKQAMGDFLLSKEYQETLQYLMDAFVDAKEYGSILQLESRDYTGLKEAWDLTWSQTAENVSMTLWSAAVAPELPHFIGQAIALSQKYDVVVTNPPYMAVSNASVQLQDYVKKNFPYSKADLFAVFIERCQLFVKARGYQTMITQHAWMFLASYESLRNRMQNERIINLAHLGPRAFDEISGEVVQTVSFVLSKRRILNYKGIYVGLTSYSSEKGKQSGYLSGYGRFVRKQEDFTAIQGSPYTSYWASQDILNAFKHNKLVGDISEPRVGMATANNDRFVRLWHEVDRTCFSKNSPSRESAKESKKKWFPFAKGGEQRKWYGNNDTVVNWENDGFEIQNFKDEKTGRIRSHNYNLDYIFNSALTWTVIGTDKTSFRYCPTGFLYSNSGYGMFCDQEETKMFLLGFMNSKIAASILQILSPSMGFESGYLRKLPLVFKKETEVVSIVKECIAISEDEWDSFETSWDFQRHPLLPVLETGITTFAGMKVSEEEWITKLRAGSICFNTVGYFIKKGEEGKNNEQGDKYEGVFAKLKNGSPRIGEMIAKLGDDLEIIDDGEYKMLRRKSCRTVPIFCLYGFFKEDAEIVSCDELGNGEYKIRLRFKPSEKIFNSFIDDAPTGTPSKNVWHMGFSLGHFQNSVEKELDDRKVDHRFTKIRYDLLDSEEFFVEPDENYRELEHKSRKYCYQKEIRWILPHMHRTEKFVFQYTPLADASAGVSKGGVYFEIEVEGHTNGNELIRDCFSKWQQECITRFQTLKSNEEELNRIFIDIYGLQDELTPEVEDKDVTVRKADLQRDIRSLISYAVGCMFGRYSLDVPGLVYAGGTWDTSKYTTFQPDKDAILPICDDEYFDDDIVGRFVKFIEVVYGKETLEENLKFIADALRGKGTSREVIRNYFLNDFYADHLKVYQKRPIYWLFDSGRKNGFKCLIYMHRYQPDTIARIRTDYVHEQQSRYRTAIADLEQRINGASTSERVKLNKQLQKLQAQAEEVRVYEEKIHHLADQMIRIDLDDGVKKNYALFQDVLAKIK